MAEAENASPAAPAAAGTPAASTAASGSITGKVVFSGTPPAPDPIQMQADPYCAAHSGTKASERLVVGAGGALKNVVVYIKGPKAGSPPAEKALLDQVGCHYQPHVLAVMAGQAITIKNSDGTLHNVHAMPEKNQGFNLGQPMQNMSADKTFANPEVSVKFKCDVHPWMNAYVAVLENPWFAVTGDDGSFTISNVPPGNYTLVAWQESLPP
ncbi:MAG: hypothetical protein JO317_01580, partial [Verrucomicrobiae bacterium]|nr:hypothetical protein [Verrucomicrobiae bacterium]